MNIHTLNVHKHGDNSGNLWEAEIQHFYFIFVCPYLLFIMRMYYVVKVYKNV